jgi:hypothetical protein
MRKKGEKNLLVFEKKRSVKNLPRLVQGQGIPFLPVGLRQGGCWDLLFLLWDRDSGGWELLFLRWDFFLR